jgi:hypothetical protein
MKESAKVTALIKIMKVMLFTFFVYDRYFIMQEINAYI